MLGSLFGGGGGAGLFGSVLSGLFGSGGIGYAKEAIDKAKEYGSDIKFRGVTTTGPTGGGTYDPTTGEVSVGLSDYAKGIFDPSMAGAAKIAESLKDFDLGQRSEQLFGQYREALDPVLEAERQQLASDLFRTGRSGVRMSGESVGAGQGTGMVQPEAYTLAQGQTQALADAYRRARGEALGEATGLAQLSTGLMGQGLALDQAAQNLMKLGLDYETARSVAAASAGDLMLQPYSWAAKYAQENRGQGMDFVGGLLKSQFWK